jgi:hypothetical protein
MPYANSEDKKVYCKEWQAKNCEHVAAYRVRTRARRSELHGVWRLKNLESRARSMQGYRDRHPLVAQIRSRIANVLKGRVKAAPTLELLDMPWVEYRIYLQGQFCIGMAWNNYGTLWEIDHIIPCANFDLDDAAQQRACFHWSNTQPMLVTENRRKGARCVV